jgi:hypothetical protein
MKPTHLLPLFFLGTLCAASALAQSSPSPKSPVAPLPALIQAPPASNFPTLTFSYPQPAPQPILRVDPGTQAALATLGNVQQRMQQPHTCFKLRTYSAPDVEDLKPNSPAPPPTTCTESAAVHMKSADLPNQR